MKEVSSWWVMDSTSSSNIHCLSAELINLKIPVPEENAYIYYLYACI
jgi:hypothetical protein